VAVVDDVAYAVEELSGVTRLLVINVADPDCPWLVAAAPAAPGSADIAVLGGHAYLAAPGRLSVMDISEPAEAHEVGASDECWLSGPPLAVSDGHAYMTGAGLCVMSIEEPSAPRHVASVYGAYPPRTSAVAVSGGKAVIAGGYHGVLLADVSQPDHALETGSYEAPSDVQDLALDGDYVYVADGYMGVKVVDVADPATPRLAGTLRWGSPNHSAYRSALYVGVDDGAAAVARNWRLAILNVTVPSAPSTVAELEGWYRDPVMVQDRLVYALISAGVVFIDSADPTGPRGVGWWGAPPGSIRGFGVADGRLYAATDDGALYVVDVGEPTRPKALGSLTGGEWRLVPDLGEVRVAVANGLAYVAYRAGPRYITTGLVVIDVADAAHPARLGQCLINRAPGEWAAVGDIVVHGTHVYVAVESGLAVLDVSRPDHPRQVGVFTTPGVITTVDAGGGHLFVGDEEAGIYVVSLPAAAGGLAK
jgi:hypothetical protein